MVDLKNLNHLRFFCESGEKNLLYWKCSWHSIWLSELAKRSGSSKRRTSPHTTTLWCWFKMVKSCLTYLLQMVRSFWVPYNHPYWITFQSTASTSSTCTVREFSTLSSSWTASLPSKIVSKPISWVMERIQSITTYGGPYLTAPWWQRPYTFDICMRELYNSGWSAVQ